MAEKDDIEVKVTKPVLYNERWAMNNEQKR